MEANDILEVKPIRLTDKENGKEYKLEFSRESVVWLNDKGFDYEQVYNNPEKMLPLLFYGAFRKNHANVSLAETNAILENKLGGFTVALVERLLMLYLKPRTTLMSMEDDYSKNEKMVVDF